LPKEIFGYNEPVFKQQLLTEGLTREVYIAPETCPTKNLSFWIVRPSKLKEQPEEQTKETYEVHEGVEEGVYIVEGRGKLLTPNESVTLEQGGCAWIPAGCLIERRSSRSK